MAGFFQNGDVDKVQQILEEAHRARMRAEVTAALLTGILLGTLTGVMLAAFVWWSL